MVAMYSESLLDVIEVDVVGAGYCSKVKQLQAQIENMKQSSEPTKSICKRRLDDSDTDEIPPEKKQQFRTHMAA